MIQKLVGQTPMLDAPQEDFNKPSDEEVYASILVQAKKDDRLIAFPGLITGLTNHCLYRIVSSTGWLNDEAINAWIQWTKTRFPFAVFLNTFFYKNLTKGYGRFRFWKYHGVRQMRIYSAHH